MEGLLLTGPTPSSSNRVDKYVDETNRWLPNISEALNRYTHLEDIFKDFIR